MNFIEYSQILRAVQKLLCSQKVWLMPQYLIKINLQPKETLVHSPSVL